METPLIPEPDSLDRYAMKGFRSAITRIRIAACYYRAIPHEAFINSGYSAIAKLRRHHEPIDPSTIPDERARDAFVVVRGLLDELGNAYVTISPTHRVREVQTVLDLTDRISAASETFSGIVRELRRTAPVHQLRELNSEVHEPDVTG